MEVIMKIFKRIIIFLVTFLALFYLQSVAIQARSTFVFTKDPGNPTLPIGSPGSWDESITLDPNVYRDADGLYKMYYFGWNHLYSSGIGYATSSDGISWTKYPGNPVLRGTPGT